MHTHRMRVHQAIGHESFDACIVGTCTRTAGGQSSTGRCYRQSLHRSASGACWISAFGEPGVMSRANDVELIRTTGATSAERRALERDVRRGRYERLRPGVLVRPGALDGMHPGEQHHVLVRASAHRAMDAQSDGLNCGP